MSLTVEQQKELGQFPVALQALVKAELNAGNSVIEVGHSFPAPPVGAYVKLANQVSTRARATGAGLDFYDRNSSIYSGEFTDAKRFFFVIEPPHPPPPEPDMDAIRKTHEREPIAEGLSHEAGLRSPRTETAESNVETKATRPLTSVETKTGWSRLLHFRDKRPPHEVQFALERELMILFRPTMIEGKLCLSAKANLQGAPYFFELRFEAALLLKNCYSLRVTVSWAEHPAKLHDYFRTTSDSWFHLWTRDLMGATPPGPDEGSAERYRKLSTAALAAEAHLDSVEAIQQAIVAAMKKGASFATCHKEGGSNISWQQGRFVRSDYGDYPDQKEFANETEFLTALRQFHQFEVTRYTVAKGIPEFDAWKLILRLLRTA